MHTPQEHMAETYELAESIATALSVGDNQKDGRWFNFQELSKAYLRHRALDLMVGLHHGFRRKWWEAFDDSPLNNVPTVYTEDDPSAEQDGEEAGDEGGQGGNDHDGIGPTRRRQSVDTARQEASKRRKGQATLHFMVKKFLPGA